MKVSAGRTELRVASCAGCRIVFSDIADDNIPVLPF